MTKYSQIKSPQKKSYSFWGLFFFLMVGRVLWAQDCSFTLSGKVIDLHNDFPIEGVLLELKPLGISKSTDSLGNYYFENLCFGKYELLVSHPSCISLRKKVLIRNHVHLPLVLEHHIDELEEVIVFDNKQKKVRQSIGAERIDTERLLRSSSQDLATVLNSISGVSTLKTGTGISKPMIHGMFGSRVGIVQNGMRLRDQEWGADHSPSVDINRFDQIELVKGAAVLQYGGDTPGGLIIMSPAKVFPKDSLYGKLISMGATNGRGGSFTGQFNGISSTGNFFKLQASLKRFGDFEAPKYVLSNTGLKAQNFFIQVGRTKLTRGWDMSYSYFSNQIGILRAAHIGNLTDLARALESETPLRINPFTYTLRAPQQKSRHQTLAFHAFQWFSEFVKLRLDYNFQQNNRLEFDVRRGDRTNQAAVDLRLRGHELTTKLTWVPNSFWDFNFGISGLLQDHFANPATGVKRLIPDYLKYQTAAFATVSQKYFKNLNLEMGLRWEYVFWDAQKYYDKSLWQERNYEVSFAQFVKQEFNTQLLVQPQLAYSNWAYHLGATLQWQPKWKSALSLIQSQRAPNAAELFSDGLHHSLATVEQGRLNLENETARKLFFETAYKDNALEWSVSPHFTHVLNYIYVAPLAIKQTIRGAFPVWEYNATTATIWGIDTDVIVQFTDQFRLTTRASWLRGRDLDQEQDLINIPPWKLFQNWSFKPNNWKRVNLFMEVDVVGQQNHYPNNNINITVLSEGELVERILDLSTPPPAFSTIDFGISIFLGNLPTERNKIIISCSNLLNTTYRDYLDRMRFYADARGRSFQMLWTYKF